LAKFKYYDQTQHLSENKEAAFLEPSKYLKTKLLLEISQHLSDNKNVTLKRAGIKPAGMLSVGLSAWANSGATGRKNGERGI